MNAFLEPYSMEVTALRPTDRGHSEPLRWVTLSRQDSARCFRAGDLFEGVDQVTLGMPYHMRLSGDAEAVLTIPNREGVLLDTSTDYFQQRNPDSVIVAVRAAAGSGAIIATSAAIWLDVPVPNENNRSLAVVNEPFIRNLLRWALRST
ncbi:MAG: hypothetical protein ACREOK_00875 [Gemmatimonadaceae bacterium]